MLFTLSSTAPDPCLVPGHAHPAAGSEENALLTSSERGEGVKVSAAGEASSLSFELLYDRLLAAPSVF